VALNALQRLPRPLRKTLDLADSERRHPSAQWHRSLSAAAFLALGCATSAPSGAAPTGAAPAPPAIGGAADRSYHLLEGRFDSADQARSTPGYPPIQLVACPAEVPSLGPRVLYVEQARLDAADAPSRQRVYVLEPREPLESAAVARVFELENPRAAVGACARARPPQFARDELIERVGCAVELRADGSLFRGATAGRGCPTTQGEATYATSEWLVDGLGLRSSESGFDATGTRRWGPQAGPVVFVRRSPPPQSEVSARPTEPGQPPPRAGPQVTDLR
jgi:CpeT/CpcT family (DUF1001)